MAPRMATGGSARARSSSRPKTGGGRTVCSRIVTPEAYRFTAATGLTIAGRVLRDQFRPGFQTPARTDGADFVLGLDGVSREDATA